MFSAAQQAGCAQCAESIAIARERERAFELVRCRLHAAIIRHVNTVLLSLNSGPSSGVRGPSTRSVI